jgi:hypothetical protein
MTTTEPANVTRAIAAHKRFEQIRHLLPHFKYIDRETDVLLYSIPAYDGMLFVIGDPANASYEWVYAALPKIPLNRA